MIAVDEDRDSARKFDEFPHAVLSLAAIYGANASGKSNVLDALSWLSSAARHSLRFFEDGIPTMPFRFGNWASKNSQFGIEMLIDGVRYEYRLELDASAVQFEALYAYPKRQRRTLFSREGLELHARRGLGGLAGAKNLITPTTLALSAAGRVERSLEIARFYQSLSRIDILNNSKRPIRRARGLPFALGPSRVTDNIFLRTPAGRNHEEMLLKALDLLRFADLGIQGVRIVTPDGDEPSGRKYLQLVHAAGEEEQAFDLQDESDGTMTWFRMIGPILRALLDGGLVLCDEIDASLHPKLTARLLDLFLDSETNPLGAQLIFTTHDTSLLEALNRDEVWFTEKVRGATNLFALAEFGGDRVRRSMNLERSYLRGRFGALPELNSSKLKSSVTRDAQESLLSSMDLALLGADPVLFDLPNERTLDDASPGEVDSDDE